MLRFFSSKFALKTAVYSKVWFQYLEIDCAVARVERLWVLERREGLFGEESDLVNVVLTWEGFHKIWEVAMTEASWGIKKQKKMFHNQVLETFWFTRRLRDLLRLTRLPRSPEELSSSSDFGRGWLRIYELKRWKSVFALRFQNFRRYQQSFHLLYCSKTFGWITASQTETPFHFLKEGQLPKSKKSKLNAWILCYQNLGLKDIQCMGDRANYLFATGGVLLLEPDPIVNFQLTAHSLNPGTQLRA